MERIVLKKEIPNRELDRKCISPSDTHPFVDNRSETKQVSELKRIMQNPNIQRKPVIQMQKIADFVASGKITEGDKVAFHKFIQKKSRKIVNIDSFDEAEKYIAEFIEGEERRKKREEQMERKKKMAEPEGETIRKIHLSEIRNRLTESQSNFHVFLNILSELQTMLDCESYFGYYSEIEKLFSEVNEHLKQSVSRKIPPTLKKECLGHGKMGTVSKVLDDDEEKVFKPDPDPDKARCSDFPLALSAVGIIRNDARPSFRSVATSRMDELLGTKVIGLIERVKIDKETGSLAPMAKGKSILNLEKTESPYDDPLVRKGLMNLQLLDAITGEVDRHPGNIFIDTASSTVRGIDNDSSFGRKISKGTDNYAKGMPQYIDAKVANKVLKIQEGDLRKTLSDVLTSQEIATTVRRLREIQVYIAEAMKKEHAASWDEIDITKLNSDNSYFYKIGEPADGIR